jgi:uncharacterized protein
MHDVTTLDCSRIAQDLQIRKVQVESVVQLLDEGNTVPFITRYRKERTGGLNEEVIRQVQARVSQLRQLAERKQTILKSIETQGKLTAELKAAILAAETVKRLEDLYLPYKPKKRSLASAARERGLEPLATAIWFRDAAVANLAELLPSFTNADKGLPTPAEVLAGVQHILAEMIAETAEVRAAVRAVLWESGKIAAAKSDKLPDGRGLEFKDYFSFSEPLRQIPPHRILALNRGEKEGALKLRLEWDTEDVNQTGLKAVAEFALKSQLTRSSSLLAQPAPVRVESTPAATAAPTAPAPAAPAVPAVPEGGAAPEAATAPAGVSAPEATDKPLAEPPPPAPATPPLLLGEPCPLPPDQGEPVSPHSVFRTPHAALLKSVVADALARLLLPSLEREIRSELTDEAEDHAVAVFARNLRSLLLQPPLRDRRVLAIDPGFRTGCKIAILDETGNLLEETVIFPHGKKAARDKGPRPAPAPATDAPAAPAGAPPLESKPEAAPATAAEPAGEAPALAAAVSLPAEVASPPVIQETPVPEASVPEASVPEATPAAAVAPETPAAPTEPAATASESPSAGTPTDPAAAAVTESPAAGAPAAKPEPGPSRRDEAKAKTEELIAKHRVQVVALGNGTGCRETEEFLSELISTRLPELAYVIVNEAGASVYSVSPVGREEFPNFDSTLRSTITIGRRLQDPLSELVKVDPQNIGVGLYQHDVKQRELKDSLDGVVESCVNQVGVDLNTASVPLLRHVSGLNQMVARELVEYRKQHGRFRTREQLLQVAGLGATRYVQAAGFLKIYAGDQPLDATWIHPESYGLAQKILAELSYGPDVVNDKSRTEEFHARLKALAPVELAARLGAGVPTVTDILEALARPGLDPREELPPPIFKKGVLKIEDLQPGMELKGTVLNVVDFGAFVDIGLKDSGLVHISQMANRYIKSPYEVAAVNDVVTVWVLTVDKERHRVSLTMIKPGTERKPPEKKPAAPRAQGPRGSRRQGGPGQGPGQQGQGPPGRGRGRRGPPPGRAAAETQAGEAAGEGSPPPNRQAPPPRTGPPRRHRRDAPKPKLSKDALEGKVPLRTFGELSALFAAKQHEPSPVAPSAPPAAPEAASPPPVAAEAAVSAPPIVEPPAGE